MRIRPRHQITEEASLLPSELRAQPPELALLRLMTLQLELLLDLRDLALGHRPGGRPAGYSPKRKAKP